MSANAAAHAAYQRHRARPARGDFELWSWYFFRVSGVLLLLLAFGHMAIMHLINNVDEIDYIFVATRWQSVGWRIYDWLLLALALSHGQNGVRIMIDDYVRSAGWRKVAHAANGVVLAVFLLLGSATLITFQAAGMPGTTTR